MSGSLSPHPVRQSARSIRSSLLRSDVKRHTYTGKRTIQRSMISSPQGDVKHTGHVGLDGAYFGDISFLDPAGCVSTENANTCVTHQPILYSSVSQSESKDFLTSHSKFHTDLESGVSYKYQGHAGIRQYSLKPFKCFVFVNINIMLYIFHACVYSGVWILTVISG